MNQKNDSHHISKLSLAGIVISLGIVFGDLGTSPLYVMQAIISGVKNPSNDFIYGALSCIIWTLTLQTTLKYVIITMKADNKGEGGILALYALIREKARPLIRDAKKKRKGTVLNLIYIVAIVGASALLADGVITPAITVTSAIEGLKLHSPSIPVIPVVVGIIIMIFVGQRFGTSMLGKSFGPIMVIWFLMLAVLGSIHIVGHWEILHSFNPYYAVKLLISSPKGFLLLGAVFLCTTGAEALYSDLGHCGLQNIKYAWFYVKICLILNYLGQGAWIISHKSLLTEGLNPFYATMPAPFLIIGVLIATMAAVIASQALISGSFSIISEAIPLNFFPRIKINYPTDVKGQMYIPMVNWVLCLACIFVVFFFKKSANMDAAYGLSITITMLMTSFLMVFHLNFKKRNMIAIAIFIAVYFFIETCFLIANLNKFMHGGWFTILLLSLIALVMLVWFKGRDVKKRFARFNKIADYEKVLKDMQQDQTIPKYASNLFFFTRADYKTDIESKIIYSIISKQPKRADKYWFIHVHYVDEPRTMEYSVEYLIPDVLIRVEFRFGFKVNPSINLFLRQVIEDMVRSKEIDLLSNYPSLRKHHIAGDFRFVLIDRIQNVDLELTGSEKVTMFLYDIFKHIGISEEKAFGLDTSNITIEKVPLQIRAKEQPKMTRIISSEPKS